MNKKLVDNTDTIVAIATPQGVGGVGIIRVSGSRVSFVAKNILGKLPTPRQAEYLNFIGENNAVLDFGIALYFPSPNSFTGEDVLELQGHGGSYVLDSVLNRIISLGARLAEPGEFTKRAFLNDKIDLNQAEAVADLIHAQSTQAANAAVKTLKGDLSKKIKQLNDKTVNLRVFVEAAFDFAEEEIDFLKENDVTSLLNSLIKDCGEILDNTQRGVKLVDGVKAVILGEPNVGKSSLLNALSNEDVAIVTTIPGTTRDVIRNTIKVDNLILNIHDTAGIRDTDCEIEQEGVRRALEQVQDSDLIIFVVDIEIQQNIEWNLEGLEHFKSALKSKQKDTKVILVVNKIDKELMSPRVELNCKIAGEIDKNSFVDEEFSYSKIYISAKTKEGVNLLTEHIKALFGLTVNSQEGLITARTRHVKALLACQNHLLDAQNALNSGVLPELVAEDLKLAHNELSTITGEFSSDDLLGKIFAEFCIGK